MRWHLPTDHRAWILRDAEEVGALPSDRVHDREDVFVALLHVRHAVEAVREADAPLVELHASHVSTEVLEVAAVQLVLPRDLDVGGQRRDEDERRTLASLLIGDPQITGTGVILTHSRSTGTFPRRRAHVNARLEKRAADR